MTVPSPSLRVAAAFGVIVALSVCFAWVWPTRYRYHDHHGGTLREDRFSGALDLSGGAAGWAPVWTPPVLTLVRPYGARPRAASRTLVVEVARTAVGRADGLHGRKSLEDDAGMLFAYGSLAPRSTCVESGGIQIDLAFLRSDGTVVRIETLGSEKGTAGLTEEELDRFVALEANKSRTDAETAVLNALSLVLDGKCGPRTRCDVPVSYVLAVNAGWFSRNEVSAGDRIDLALAMEGLEVE